MSNDTITIGTARIGLSGESLILALVRVSDGAPSEGPIGGTGLPEPVVLISPTYTINGGPPIPLSASQYLPYANRLYWPIAPVQPTDVIRLTAPEGWALTMDGTAVALDYTLPVPNGSGMAQLPAFAATPKTMKVGYNIPATVAYPLCQLYSNLIRNGDGWLINAVEQLFPPYTDGNGNLILIPPAFDPIVSPVSTLGGNVNAVGSGLPDLGTPTFPDGTYILSWHGTTASLSLADFTLNTAITVDSTTDTGAGATRQRSITHTITSGGGKLGKNLAVVVSQPVGTVCDLTAVSLTYPGSGASPGVCSADFLAQFGKASCMRMMDAMNTNNSNVVHVSDITPADAIFYASAQTKNIFAITDVDTWVPDGSFPMGSPPYLLFTTATAHGISELQSVNFNSQAGNFLAQMTGYNAAIGYGPALTASDLPAKFVHVTDPTHFVYSQGDANWGTVAGPQAIVGQGFVQNTAMVPPAVQCTMAVETKADLWVNIPWLMTDADSSLLAATYAASLAPGKALYVEWANEVWNAGFFVWDYVQTMGLSAGYSPDTAINYFHAQKSTEHRLIWEMAFSDAGKSSQLRWVYGAAAFATASSSPTAQIVEWCLAHSIQNHMAVPFDAALGPVALEYLAIAPYYDAPPVGPDPAGTFGIMSLAQLFDFNEDYLPVSPNYTALIDYHRTTLHDGFPQAQLVAYEGGIERACPAGPHAGKLSRDFVLHPRYVGFCLAYLQQMQDHGISLFNWYAFASDYGTAGINGGTNPDTNNAIADVYSTYMSASQRAGPGLANLTTIPDSQYDRLDSVQGFALNQWVALTMPDVTPPETPTNLDLVNEKLATAQTLANALTAQIQANEAVASAETADSTAQSALAVAVKAAGLIAYTDGDGSVTVLTANPDGTYGTATGVIVTVTPPAPTPTPTPAPVTGS